ncbi:MAG: hypothetical protein U0Q04_02080 [Microbacterium sp.]
MAIALRTIAFPYRAVASFVILVGIARLGPVEREPFVELVPLLHGDEQCALPRVDGVVGDDVLRDAQSKGWHGVLDALRSR